MKVNFLEPAFLEYQEAIEFYKLQSEGLELRFIAEIHKTVSIIKNYPESFLTLSRPKINCVKKLYEMQFKTENSV